VAGRLVVAQDQQVGRVDDAAGQAAGRRAVERRGADADQRQRLAQRARERGECGRAAQERQRRAPGCRVQRLEHRAAGDDDGVSARDQAHDARDVVAADGGQAVLGGGRGRVGRGDERRVVAQGVGERGEQRLVAGVALAERAGQEDARAAGWGALGGRAGCDGGHPGLP
jgi:hypothetical protein